MRQYRVWCWNTVPGIATLIHLVLQREAISSWSECLFRQNTYSFDVSASSWTLCRVFSLRTLELFGLFSLTHVALFAIGKCCPNLVTLNVGQCWKVTRTSFSFVVPHFYLSVHARGFPGMREFPLIREQTRANARAFPRYTATLCCRCIGSGNCGHGVCLLPNIAEEDGRFVTGAPSVLTQATVRYTSVKEIE